MKEITKGYYILSGIFFIYHIIFMIGFPYYKPSITMSSLEIMYITGMILLKTMTVTLGCIALVLALKDGVSKDDVLN